MDGWNTSFLLGWPILRCYVSFREGILWSTLTKTSRLAQRDWMDRFDTQLHPFCGECELLIYFISTKSIDFVNPLEMERFASSSESNSSLMLLSLHNYSVSYYKGDLFPRRIDMKTSLRTSNLPPWVRQLRIMKQKPQLQEQRWRHFGEELFVLPLSWLDKTFEDLGMSKARAGTNYIIFLPVDIAHTNKIIGVIICCNTIKLCRVQKWLKNAQTKFDIPGSQPPFWT